MSVSVRLSLTLSVLLFPAAAAAQTDEPEPSATLKYDKGFIVTSGDGDFELKTGIRSQFRYELVSLESADEIQSRFYIPRLRLQLEGHAFGKANTYKVEHEFHGRGQTILKDFYVNHAFSPTVQVRLGQWKKPFARHELISDFASEFNERSLANGLVDIGRDLGVMLHNGYDKSPEIEWAVGVFNGQGDADRNRQVLTCTDPADATSCSVGAPTNVPADIGPLFVARVGWNMGGIKGYSEGDLEGGPLRVAIGASYQADFNDFEKDANDDVQLEHGAVVDALIKVAGADLQGAAYMLKVGQADADFSFFGQAGYFLVPERFQLCGRFSYLPAGEDDNVQEILGAFNVYFKGHNLKWATDAGAILTSASDTTDYQVRTMVQLVL
jgi:hypothetical protein